MKEEKYINTIYSSRFKTGFGSSGSPFDACNIQRYVPAFKPDDLKDNKGFLVLWGGEDISPSIYGQLPGTHTYADDEPSLRDQMEMAMYRRAVEMNLPIVAVCRGAQLACCMEGGKLVQHVQNHGRDHEIVTQEDGKFITSSVHHQMMYPWNVPDYDLIAWAEGRSTCHLGELDEEIEFPEEAYDSTSVLKEPEVIFFKRSRCLAIQGHPEFMDFNAPFVKWINRLIGERFGL